MNDEKMLRDYSLVGVESQKAIEMGLADAEWYQSPIPRDKMRELLVRKDGPAIRDTIIWFSLIFGSGYLVFLWWGSWIVILPYIVYSVLYASTSDSRWHESSHGTAFKTDWMNNLLYEIASFMVFRQSTVWRWSHARHHSDTIIRGRDPEIAVPRPPRISKIILTFFGISAAISETKKLLRHVAGRIDQEVATYVPEQEHKKVFFKARVFVSIYLLVIALSIIYGTVLPLMFIGLPTLLGSWLMPVYGLTQHAGLQENVLDHRLNCRTVYMNRVNRFLYWNMNYHVEHHMFPLVPYHALPKLHELMKDDCPKPYNGIIETFKEIIPAVLKQRKDLSYYVERKLPETALTKNIRSKNRFVGSEKNLVDGKIEVCAVSDLPKGEVVRFDFDQKTYAVYRTEEDGLYATEGNCTHGNAHLGDGVVIGDIIECAKHNGRFSLKDGSPRRAPVCVGINTYEAIAGNGKVYLKLAPIDVKVHSKELNFKVVSNNNVATFIKELVLEPSNGEAFSFSPGQYIQLVIPPFDKLKFNQFDIDQPFRTTWDSMNLLECYAENLLYLKRNYSMATNPANEKQLKFNVRIALPPDGENVTAGAGSSYVFNLKPGDEVKLAGPYGDFQIKPTEREMVYLGGGAGMAPLRSHLAYLFETDKTKRKVSYWYGARSKAELYYHEYFERLQDEHENFSFHIALSEPISEDNWNGYVGFIHDVLSREYLKNHSSPNEVEYYLCGPPVMIKSGLEMLDSLGIQKDKISYDEF
ncbi:MAG: NADH:ubiquinone reductase (Na(+)-transporting) subunit F [Prolixibacteraceae bacterium]|nr:NADH:ubiquinone reductase (Na(+)-transporting) subunit F [Prolixibacteraceae bacterium]